MAGVEFSMSGGNFGAVNVASASVNPVLPALAGNHRPGIERPVSVGRYGEHSCHCAQPAEQWRPHLRPALLQNQRGMARRGLSLHGGVDKPFRRTHGRVRRKGIDPRLSLRRAVGDQPRNRKIAADVGENLGNAGGGL